MSYISISTRDIDCRYLAAPESRDQSQFGRHLKSLGIKLPPNLSIRTMVARGWLKPRLRVALPPAALLSWLNFPTYSADYDDTCPPGDAWALNAWCASACSWQAIDRPIEKLWMHWLDDPDDGIGICARANAIDPSGPAAEPPSFVHPNACRPILPWIDYFADWQAFQVAELVRMAKFEVHGVIDSTGGVERHLRRHVDRFDEAAKGLVVRWEERGHFFDRLACYRTILAQVARRDSFGEDAQRGVQSWASQQGVDAVTIRAGIRDVLLRLWRHWEDLAPVSSERLRHRLQQDLQYATGLLADLADKSIDPFDPFWCSQARGRGDCADLIDALPYEEWTARRKFPQQAMHYQKGFPAPFLLGSRQFSELLAEHWPTSAALRRFCLAWVRLHEEMGQRDLDLPADMTIKANERIEQFNLIGLHTERLLRDVIDRREPEIKPIVRAAICRAVRVVAKPYQNLAGKRVSELLEATRLHDQRPAEELAISAAGVATGSDAADAIIAAHLNALIARNYAAHHDYLDNALIYPNRDKSKPHAGATLLSSCLLVVIAALQCASLKGVNKS